jgi:DNA replication and repair protein RecF
LIGDNNQGKTSVLESVYYLANFKSFLRKTTRKTVIRHNADSAVIGGEFEHCDTVYQRYVKLESNQQWVFQNQELLKTHTVAHTQLGADYISADTIRLFYDSPAFRRHQLDVCVQKKNPTMRTIYRQYDRVIQQKIESVKCGREWPAVYHERWQTLGTRIVEERHTMLNTLNQHVQPLIHQFSQLEHTATQVRYIPVVSDLYSQPSTPELYRVGPHVDDWGIYINDQLVSQYYSRGINRILALIMVSLQIQLTQPPGQTHQLLLDDPFIELDAGNKASIMQYLWNQFYCIYATTSASDHPSTLPHFDQFYIKNGCIHPHT